MFDKVDDDPFDLPEAPSAAIGGIDYHEISSALEAQIEDARKHGMSDLAWKSANE